MRGADENGPSLALRMWWATQLPSYVRRGNLTGEHSLRFAKAADGRPCVAGDLTPRGGGRAEGVEVTGPMWAQYRALRILAQTLATSD